MEKLIDGIALIGKARRMETTDNNGIPVDTFAVPVQVIEDAPTVDAVEVVHGHWGIYRENEISKTVYCTHCWKEFYIRKKGELQLDKMPYCPNCGARMDGDKNGS